MKIMNKIMILGMTGLSVMLLAIGCDKKEAASSDPHADHNHAAGEMNHEDHDMAMDTAKDMVEVVVGEQTICPVMGNAINKDYYTEYKGKKVYFCCPGCDKLFNENPEKYLSKLPQFGGKEESK